MNSKSSYEPYFLIKRLLKFWRDGFFLEKNDQKKSHWLKSELKTKNVEKKEGRRIMKRLARMNLLRKCPNQSDFHKHKWVSPEDKMNEQASMLLLSLAHQMRSQNSKLFKKIAPVAGPSNEISQVKSLPRVSDYFPPRFDVSNKSFMKVKFRTPGDVSSKTSWKRGWGEVTWHPL